MTDFDQQLFGAWRASGLDAAPRGDGGITFCCPKCEGKLPGGSRLEVANGIATCPACAWGETGEPWDIARAAAKARPVEKSGDLAATLLRARFNIAVTPPQPAALYSLGEHTIATAENLMVVQAKMKAGKSAAIGAMLASTMQPTGDCLHFRSANDAGHAVLHFDTEQSSFDHHRLIVRSIHRAGRQAPPPWLYSYHVKGQTITTMRALVMAGIESAAGECGGVHSVVLDGIADLCADVNNPAEANALVAELEAAAIRWKTVIVCVLHENQGSEIGKTRGHLGSQLARKAETNLRLEKDSDGATLMFTDTARSAFIPKKDALKFLWSDETKCHVSAGSTEDERARKNTAFLRSLAVQCFAGVSNGLSWTRLRDSIKRIEECSQTQAETFLREMSVDGGVVTKVDSRYFYSES